MSMTTTSANCFSATPRATVAPTFPAPPTTVTLRFIAAPDKNDLLLHVLDDSVPELRGLQFGRAVHQAREVVGHALRRDGAVHSLHDEIGSLRPAEVTQHHLAGEHDRSRIDLVLIRVLRRGAVRRLEHGVASYIIDVAAGRD